MSISVSAQNEDNPTPLWYVYIIENRLGQLYTGVTVDLERRLRQHRGELAGGAKALKGKAPLHYRLSFKLTTKQSAMQLEYAIKQLNKAHKLSLIKGCRERLPPQLVAQILG